MTNEEVLRAYVEAFNSADWERLASLFTLDAKIRGVLGWGGLYFALPIWRELHDNMHMRLRIDDLMVGEEKAAALFTETGSFEAPFRSFPGQKPTHKSYEVLAIEWFEFKGGRIARRWGARDSGAISRQVLG